MADRVVLSGPFFTKDPGKTVQQNIKAFVDGAVAYGEAKVKASIEAKSSAMPYWTGHTRDHVVGRTQSLRGKEWRYTGVVSANTNGMSRREAIRTKAAAASIEARWHPFRRALYAIAGTIRKLDLTKGLE